MNSTENCVEEWRDLPEELMLSKYEISTLGNLRNKKTQYVLSNKPRKDGYVSGTLFLDNSTNKTFCVHVLVAKAFIPNPDNKPTVNHININQSDNRVINLEWATYSEQSLGENRNSYNIKGYKSINQYDLEGNFIKTWEKAIDAEKELKIDRRNILDVLKNRKKTSGGFIWKYKIEENLPDEIWKECPLGSDFGKVLASNMGRLKIKNNNFTYGTKRKNGYYDIKVFNEKDNKYKAFRVHHLICLAFKENPENKPFVNHKDENPSNNNIENLEWMTNKENVNYSLNLHNRIKANSRSRVVLQIKDDVIINEFPSIHQASKQTGIKPQYIAYRCLGKTPQDNNYVWEFK